MILETMIWVAVIVIAAILEGMSAQLISIWFVGGGIAGMIAQLCGAPVWLQVPARSPHAAAVLPKAGLAARLIFLSIRVPLRSPR